MNKLTPIILLLLVALAGAYVVFFEIREDTRMKTRQEEELRKGRVFDVDVSNKLADSITELAITRQDVENLEFRREKAGVWQIVQPVDAPARTALIDGIVGGVLFMRKSTENITALCEQIDELTAQVEALQDR